MGARLLPAGSTINRLFFSFCVLATELSPEDGKTQASLGSVWNESPKGSCRERQEAGQGGRPTSSAEKETHSFYAHD